MSVEWWTMFVSIIKDYLINSSFHGLRFIAEDGRHWTERIFWLCCCLLSWYGSGLLILSAWDGFQHSAISFVVETTYLHMETSFPTISVCESDNMERVTDVALKRYGEVREYNLDEILKEIAYFKESVYYMKEHCSELDCPKTGFKKIVEEVRSPCKDVFKTCMWKNETFDCCRHFLPLETELGLCFTLNAKYELPENPGYLNLKSSQRLGLGNLYLELMVPTKVFMHAEADVPFHNTMQSDFEEMKPGTYTRLGISMIDTENEPEVKQLSISQRSCRFPDENYLTVSSVYSYTACIVQCRLAEQLKRCNCCSHLIPYTDEKLHCDMNGILCLSNNQDYMKIQKTPWSDKKGLDCFCLPGCEEHEFQVVGKTQPQITVEHKKKLSIIEIFLVHLPSQRYKRNVVRGQLDLVVSAGGTAGLFVGASLLSFAELVYYFTLRLYNNLRSKKHRQDTRAIGVPVKY